MSKTPAPKALLGTAKSTSKVKVPDAIIQRLTRVFKILGHTSRMKILTALAQDGELHVTALCNLLKQSQPAISHHLTLMRMTGLVGYRRDGQQNFYFLDFNQLRDVLEQVFADYGDGHRQILFKDFSLSYKRLR